MLINIKSRYVTVRSLIDFMEGRFQMELLSIPIKDKYTIVILLF